MAIAENSFKRPGITIEQRGDYAFYHLERMLPREDMQLASQTLVEITKRNELKKLCLFIEVKFTDVDPATRLETMRFAETGFQPYDKVAVLVTDPMEHKQLKGSIGLLAMTGAIKDPTNFRFFNSLDAAERWISR